MPDIKQDLLSLQYSQNFEIQGMQEANVDLELPPASTSTATVYGTVTDGTDPVADATVKLFDSAGLPYKHTMTGADGTFSMTGIPAGTYTLMASADGYMAVSSVTAVIAGGSISNVVMTMTVDGRTYTGTVSGISRDNAGRAVAGCSVGLYQVTDVAGVSQERLVSVTKTNAAGKYLFGGVGGGEYLVKAKLEQ